MSRTKLKIKIIQDICKSKGGECISKKYINSITPMIIRCKYGHVWKARPANIIYNNSWCPMCDYNNRKVGIELYKKKALDKGGECLSDVYINHKTPIKFKCENGHVWSTRPDSIHKGSWCPKCYGNHPLSIEDCKNDAILNEGKCLPKKIKNSITKLTYQCKYGHIWKARPKSIREGRWCPECAKKIHKTEELCRKIFEKLFNKSFPNKRYNWLKGEFGRNRELDGYNKELKLAFEYQGEQHYNMVPFFNKTQEDLNKQKLKDEFKRNKCKERQITLIEIPFHLKNMDLEQYIISKLKKRGFIKPKGLYSANSII